MVLHMSDVTGKELTSPMESSNPPSQHLSPLRSCPQCRAAYASSHALQVQHRSALKEQAASKTAPQAPLTVSEQLMGGRKRRHPDQATASAGVPAAAVRAGAGSFKDIQLAQQSRKAPATPAAHDKRKAARPGAGGPCWHASSLADEPFYKHMRLTMGSHPWTRHVTA